MKRRAGEHLLLIAFACEPHCGSEPGLGWELATALAANGHKVHVITHACHRAGIEAELMSAGTKDPVLNRLAFTYLKLPAPLSWLRKCQAGLNFYYYAWQIAVGRLAKELHARLNFDLVHHGTYARCWMPSGAAALACDEIGVPFVWGPVGGGEDMPDTFCAGLGTRGMMLTIARRAARAMFELDPMLRRTARRAALTLATTPESAQRLRAIGAKNVEVCSAIGLAPGTLELAPPELTRESRRRIRFLGAGRLLYWKGFHLGLRAFAEAKLDDAEYVIVGNGPDRRRLAALARELNITDRVAFKDGLPRNEFLREIAACDVFVHPSLHDSGGGVCLEAMAARKPVLVLDLGGPGTLVDAASGVRVRAETPEQAIGDLAQAMRRLAGDAALREKLGIAGHQRCREVFAWDHRAERFEAFYERARAEMKTRNRPAKSSAGASLSFIMTGDRAKP